MSSLGVKDLSERSKYSPSDLKADVGTILKPSDRRRKKKLSILKGELMLIKGKIFLLGLSLIWQNLATCFTCGQHSYDISHQ